MTTSISNTFIWLCSGLLCLGIETWVEGTSQPKERITISSPVDEIVAEVLVKEGQVVEKGHTLAHLLATEEELEVKRLEILIADAENDFQTTAGLYAKKIESKSTYLEKKSILEQLQVDKEIAENKIKERTIFAPCNGTVVYRLIDPGESVERTKPVFEIIDASKLDLILFLPTDYLHSLKEDMQVEVEFPELKENAQGTARLVFIDPQLDSRSGLFRVRFEFDNTQAQVKPGLRVRVKLPKE